jgi:hypothetical protein
MIFLHRRGIHGWKGLGSWERNLVRKGRAVAPNPHLRRGSRTSGGCATVLEQAVKLWGHEPQSSLCETTARSSVGLTRGVSAKIPSHRRQKDALCTCPNKRWSHHMLSCDPHTHREYPSNGVPAASRQRIQRGKTQISRILSKFFGTSLHQTDPSFDHDTRTACCRDPRTTFFHITYGYTRSIYTSIYTVPINKIIPAARSHESPGNLWTVLEFDSSWPAGLKWHMVDTVGIVLWCTELTLTPAWLQVHHLLY